MITKSFAALFENFMQLGAGFSGGSFEMYASATSDTSLELL
jgi:hypothetical protein